MANYLLVWGKSAHAVRFGTGDERSAAVEAFGVYDPKRMTIMAVNQATLRSDCKRTNFIAQILLPAHLRKMEAAHEPDAIELINNEIARITKDWQPEWNRYNKKH